MQKSSPNTARLAKEKRNQPLSVDKMLPIGFQPHCNKRI